MQYIIQLCEDSDHMEWYAAPVEESDSKYLDRASGHFRPLSHEQYAHGFAVLFQTAARYSYLLDDDSLLICIEWEPGLLVLKVSLEGELHWTALRSPIPNFGGRVPLPEDGDPDAYEGLDNPQYSLVFTPWDAQFDHEDREYYHFSPADSRVVELFKRFLATLASIGESTPKHEQPGYDSWRSECIENLSQWSGVGVRL